jgi:baseplate J-like protein
VAAPSLQDLYDQGRARALVTRPDLTVLPGSIVDMEMAAGAAMGDLVVGNGAQQAKVLFLDGANRDDLTALVRDRYGIERYAAVASIGSVRLSRATFAAGAGSVPAGTRIATLADATGATVEVVTDVPAVFGATDLTHTVTATASVAGTAGNVVAGALSRILDTLFDTSIVVTNVDPFVGGAEEETDVELRARARSFSRTLRRGTIDALETGARVVSAVRVATAVEESNTGLVTVYVTDADGNSNPAMVTAVTTELVNWRAAGSNVQVVGGALYSVSISVSLTVRAGVSIPALVSKVVDAIVSAVNRLGIGETLYRSLITDAARQVDRDNILEVTVLTPAANVAPTASQVIRTSSGLVAAS